jgi:hypothetical protein
MRRRPILRGFRAGAVCAWLGLTAVASAASPFPPGLEKDISALVDGPSLSGGCEPNGIRIEAAAIDIRVECGKEFGVLVLTAGDDNDAGALRRSPSFVMRLVDTTSPAVKAAATELAEQIAKRDNGTLLGKAVAIRETRTDQREGVQARKLGLIDNLRRAGVWLGLLLLLVWLVATLLRREIATREGIAWVAALTGIYLLALILRIKLGYWAPIHANQHGVLELRGLAASASDWRGPIESDRYGVGYQQVMRGFLAPFHGGARGVFAFSIIASALGVVALGQLAAALTGSRIVGGIAAIGLALHPIHIGLSATESSLGLAGTLFLIGAASLCSLPTLPSVREQRVAWWVGALALSASCELGVVTVAFPLAGLLLALGVLRKGSGAEGAWQIPLLVLAASLALHVDALWPLLHQVKDVRGSEFLGTLRGFHGEHNSLSVPNLVASSLLPMAGAGAAILLIRRPRVGVALLLASGVLLAASGVVNGCRTDMIRYQPLGHLLLFVAAGSVLLILEGRRTSLQLSVGFAVAVILVLPAQPALAALRKPLLDVSAYHLADRAAELLPNNVTILMPPRRMAARNILSDFPEYVLQARGKAVQLSPIDENPPVDSQACAVWIPPACFSFTGEEAAARVPENAVKLGQGSLRPECQPLVNHIDPTKEPFLAAELPVPFRAAEFLRVAGTPLVGLFPCK